MAESQQKRLRSEETPEDSNPKRPRTSTFSLLEDDESIFTTLQKEISIEFDSPEDQKTEDEEESVRSVMRHLLEASDDELGIPNPEESSVGNSDFGSDEDFVFDFDPAPGFVDGIWELEDAAANYDAVLQSELLLFM